MTDVTVEKVGERIHLYSEWFPGVAEMCKSVPGHRWDKTGRHWTYPLTLSTCRILRKVFTDMLVIGPDLANWAWEEKARVEYLEKLGAQMDSELLRIPDIAPAMAAAMANRTYQRVGARFIGLTRECLLADEPTLGKTIQYLGGIIEAGVEEGMHLITAPKSALESVWGNEVHKWCPDTFRAYWMPEGRAKRERMLDMFIDSDAPTKFLIINPEMLQVKVERWCKKCEKWEPPKPKKGQTEDYDYWPMEHWTDAHDLVPKVSKCEWPGLFDIEWNSVCVDESHKYLLGIRSANKKTQAGEGYSRLRVKQGGVRLAATGTPLKGRALNFWSTFHWLKPSVYGSKWAFAESFLEITDNGFGKSIGDIRDDREQELYESLRPIMLRRTKREVQPDLPEDMYQDHWVSMQGEHFKQYQSLVLEGEAEIEGGTLSTTGVLAQYTREKQFAFGPWRNARGSKRSEIGLVPTVGSPKLELLLNLLEKRGVTGKPDEDFRLEGGFKYIVGSQFTAVIDFIEKELEAIGIKCLKITGAVTSKKRTDAIAGFQSEHDDHRVLLINTLAGGAALTLDAWCDEMFILDETWVRDEQIQLEGRIRNRDVEKRVAVRTYHYIRTKDTIEQEIAESGLSQDEFQKTLLDRSRGVKLQRRELGED